MFIIMINHLFFFAIWLDDVFLTSSDYVFGTSVQNSCLIEYQRGKERKIRPYRVVVFTEKHLESKSER